jgi:Domain of unknown function (DUF4115)
LLDPSGSCDREVISMLATGLLLAVAFAAATTYILLRRPRVPPMEQRKRALAALRDLAEQPRPQLVDPVPPPSYPTEHVRILEQVPPGARPRRRTPARRPAARQRNGHKPRKAAPTTRPLADRPTIAVCPSPAFAEGDEPAVRLLDPAISVEATRVVVPEPDAGVAEAVVVASPADEVQLDRPRSRLPLSRLRLGTPGVVAAVAALTLGTILAVAYSNQGSSSGRARAGRVVSAPPPTAASTTVPAPTTTVPVAAVPVATVPIVARSTNGATVSVRSPSSLTLQATGACWIEVDDATGHTLFSGTLHAGQQQQIAISGPLVLHLGYTPAVIISVNSTKLDLSGLSQTASLSVQTL